jgi:glycosyltransferase involved in cell wall biosynthesis
MIKLGINLIDFKKNYLGGINSFTLGLIEELEKKNIKVIIYTNKESEKFLKIKFKKSKIFVFNKNKFYLLFVQFFCIIFNLEKTFCAIENYYYSSIKKKIEDNCNIFYCPLSYLKPYNLKIPTLCSPHDFQHLHYPKYFKYLKLKYRTIAFNLTVKKSTKIQASSYFIKRDIQKNYNINHKKITIINEGVSNKFKFSAIKFKANDYIFFPAQLWFHKNHLMVLNSLKLIYEKYKINLKIILVGDKFDAYNNILNFIKKNKELNINYLGKVDFKKLLNLYKNCKLVISPSLYESSSIPILEACKIGRPVICSNIKPNEELSKKLKINIFKRNNSKHLLKILLKVWFNHRLIKSQIYYNKSKIDQFNWSKIADKYILLLDQMINSKNINKNHF